MTKIRRDNLRLKTREPLCIQSSLQVLMLLLLPCSAPLDLEVLDGAASSASLSLIQNADGPLTISQIRLKVNGLVIDVLVKLRLVWNLETLPEL